MAAWSLLSDGSSLDSIDILRNLGANGLGPDDGKDQTIRTYFDQILSLFLKEIFQKDEIQLATLVIGDGQSVDLFKLYWVVRQNGGYDSVTLNQMWGAVALEIGLAPHVAPSVKLIYSKYLYALDRWLRMVFDREGIPGGTLSVGLEMEIRGFLHGCTDWKMDGWRLPERGSESNTGVALESGSGDVKKCSNGFLGREEFVTIDSDHGSNEATVVDFMRGNKDVLSLKRKWNRERLLGMLNWVIKIAKNPGDPVLGKMLETPRRKAIGVEEYLDQVLLVREMMCLRRPAYCSSEGSILQLVLGEEVLLLVFHWYTAYRPDVSSVLVASTQGTLGYGLGQKRQRMHPSMYNDHNGTQSTERLRCSRRLLFLRNKSQSGSVSAMSMVPDNDVEDIGNDPNERVLRTIGSLNTEAVIGMFCKDQIQKRVPIGSFFQAEVPEWTGMDSKSLGCPSTIDSGDSKWLGTQQWPIPNLDNKSLSGWHPIGKGRPDSCNCKLPGSVECIRFHVAEKRHQLKLELGSTFYGWKFDRMGEEVSLSWTEEEEQRFKAASVDKNFWQVACRGFSSRSRQNFVSYYYNAFLLRRRSYQNHVTPNNIDSDDEESEFSWVSSSFSDDTIKDFGSKSTLCTLNRQCVDLVEDEESGVSYGHNLEIINRNDSMISPRLEKHGGIAVIAGTDTEFNAQLNGLAIFTVPQLRENMVSVKGFQCCLDVFKKRTCTVQLQLQLQPR
ncbi:hypothetical protein ACLOJK_015487 [Asimina triloba]